MTSSPEEDIRTNAKLCFDTFGRLCRLYGEDSWFEDQKARCNLWASDLGVFAPMRVSADHRLRDYPVIRQVINQLLRGMAANLDHLAKLCSSDLISTSDGHEQNQEQEENLSDSSGSSYTVPSLPSETNYEKIDSDAMSQCRLSVKDAITRLYTISASIRHSGSRYRDQRAEAFVREDPERQSQADSFFAVSKAILSFKYQNVNEQLRERTAMTIVLRQNRISYRRSHREKRAEVILDLPEESPIIRDATHSETSATKTNLHPLEHNLKSGTDHDASQSSAGSSTWSSTFGSTDSQNMQPLELPQPPDVKPGDYFNCNYCCKLCPAEETNAKRWRKHIIRDLKPYFCVLEDCPTPAELFDSFNDWLLHMRQAHQRYRWVCFSPAHEVKTFNTESLYIGHMESDHSGSFSRAELPNLTRMAMSSKFHIFTTCPFCLRPPKGSDSPAEGLITNEEEYRLQKHVAAHLMSLALVSLRWVDDSDKARLASSSSVAHSKRSTLSGRGSGYSLSFQDPPGPPTLGEDEQDPNSGLVVEKGQVSHALDTQSTVIGQETDSFDPITEAQYSQNDTSALDIDNLAHNLVQTTIDPSTGSLKQQKYEAGWQKRIMTRDSYTDREEFDPHYKVHGAWQFKLGKIFKVLWAEPKDEQGNGSVSNDSFTLRIGMNGKETFASVRRFVIIKPMEGHCICLPISTYSGQGVNKRGVHAKHHAIIYSGKKPIAFKGEKEKGLRMRSIKVSPDSPRHKLDDASRLNYAKNYTVEYNMKVWFIGKVASDSEWQILSDYNRVHPPLEIKGVPSYGEDYGDSVDTLYRQAVSSAGYNPYVSYGSRNTAQTGDIQEALSERHETPTFDTVGEEDEYREAGYDDIYDA